jgi:hypothetical protein
MKFTDGFFATTPKFPYIGRPNSPAAGPNPSFSRNCSGREPSLPTATCVEELVFSKRRSTTGPSRHSPR